MRLSFPARWLRICGLLAALALLGGCAVVVHNERTGTTRVIRPGAKPDRPGNKSEKPDPLTQYAYFLGEMHINGKELVVRIPSSHRLDVTPLETFLSEKRTPNEGVLWGVRMNRSFEFTLQPTPYCINSGNSPRAFSVAYINSNDGLIHSILDFPAGDAIARCVSVFSGVEDTTPYTGNFLMMPYGWFDAVGIKEGDRFDQMGFATVFGASEINRFGMTGFIIDPISTSGGAQDILDEWEEDPASALAATRAMQAPVIATWNGQALTHVEVTGREIGKAKDEQYHLLVTAILDVNEPNDTLKDEAQLKAIHEQRVQHVLPLIQGNRVKLFAILACNHVAACVFKTT